MEWEGRGDRDEPSNSPPPLPPKQFDSNITQIANLYFVAANFLGQFFFVGFIVVINLKVLSKSCHCDRQN